MQSVDRTVFAIESPLSSPILTPPLNSPLRIVGVMSGTSMDGVDCALCTCRLGGIQLVRLWSRAFPKALAGRLHATARGDADAWECGQLHHDLGRFYAEAISRGLRREAIDAVGLHGQTVFHQPHRPAATWQIGEPAWIAEKLRVPVISNFRVADLAAGGQGAPLATLFHKMAFARPGTWTAVQNLGGIGNVTLIDASASTSPDVPPRILAFDTGPANVLLDLATRLVSGGKDSFDKNGRRAAAGTIDNARLTTWLRHPFFRKRPPKSTGRELFGEPFLREILADWPEATRDDGIHLLATLTELTARSIAENYRRHLPRPASDVPVRVILAGGGAANAHLVRRIRAALEPILPNLTLATSDDCGWPRQAIEPAAFALLGAAHLWGVPGNLPETTGAAGPRILGQLTLPPPFIPSSK
jgi:anhydro-N-acetylmuramic acid kinase